MNRKSISYASTKRPNRTMRSFSSFTSRKIEKIFLFFCQQKVYRGETTIFHYLLFFFWHSFINLQWISYTDSSSINIKSLKRWLWGFDEKDFWVHNLIKNVIQLRLHFLERRPIWIPFGLCLSCKGTFISFCWFYNLASIGTKKVISVMMFLNRYCRGIEKTNITELKSFVNCVAAFSLIFSDCSNSN